MDNRAQERPGGLHQKGIRFFVEDEDEFGLEDTLQVTLAAASQVHFTTWQSWYGLSHLVMVSVNAGAVLPGKWQHICARQTMAAGGAQQPGVTKEAAERCCPEATGVAGSTQRHS